MSQSQSQNATVSLDDAWAAPVAGLSTTICAAAAVPASGLSTAIELDNGSKVSLVELGLPQELHAVLEQLANGRNPVSSSYLHQQSKLARELAKHVEGSRHSEAVGHIDLLGRILKQKESDSDDIDYTHMSKRAQEVLRSWDEDGSGTISCKELEDAAKSHRYMKNRMGRMRLWIIFLITLLCGTLGAIFAVSVAAAELSKESHIDGREGGPKMISKSGDVVQVASSDFTGADGGVLRARSSQVCAELDAGFAGGCRRLTEGEGVPIQVARAVQGISGLTSALPDATFGELHSVKLEEGNHTLHLAVSTWQRVAVRSSACGSVVHLHTSMGRLTLDDRVMSADAQLEQQLKQAGFGSLFSTEAGGGLGRRLEATDGMLKGFFNLIRGMEQKCMPQPLEPPEDLLKQFSATVNVKVKIAGNSESALSQFFTDRSGRRLPMPGFEIVQDNLTGQVLEGYRVWTEEVLSGPGVEVIRATSAMHPFLKQVRIASGGAELSLVVDESMGFHCAVEQVGEGGAEEDEQQADGSDNQDMRMEMLGLIEEDGILLRHFRLSYMAAQKQHVERRRLQGKLTEADEKSTETMAALIEAGIFPTHTDYFDVDSDPSGVRSPGDPYRIRQDSTVPGSSAFQEKTYIAVKPLDGELTVEETFRLLNVTTLASACAAPPNTVTAAMASLLTKVPVLTMNGTKPPPPTFEPKAELGSSILASYDQLIQAKTDVIRGARPSEALLLAQSTLAWQAALREDPKIFRPELVALIEGQSAADLQDMGGSEGNTTRRLDAHERRAAAACRASEGGLGSRSLAAEGGAPRRLGTTLDFLFAQNAWVAPGGNRGFSLDVAAGPIAGMALDMEFDKDNKILAISGTASGTIIVYSPPTIELTFSGSISKTGSVVAGELGIEAAISVLGIEFGAGIAIGASMDIKTMKLLQLYGKAYIFLNRIRIGGTMVLKPVGCGANYYKRWQVALSFQFGRDGRVPKLSFDFDIPLFSKEIGASGCT